MANPNIQQVRRDARDACNRLFADWLIESVFWPMSPWKPFKL